MICTGAEEVIVSVLVFPETPEAWEKAGWEVYQDFEHPIKGKWMLRHTSHCKNGKDEDYDIVDIEGRSPETWADVFYECGFFHQYPVPAKPSLQEIMLERYRVFWEKHVIPGIPPEPENYDDIKRLFVEPVGTIVCDEELERWWTEYDLTRTEVGSVGKRQEKLKTMILNRARKLNPVLDDESQEKVVFRSENGRKLGQYSKKGGFR
jgi:hypothetical protein